MALFRISGPYNSDHEAQGLLPLVSAAGQKLLVFVLSHFFPSFLNDTSQMLVLLSLDFPFTGAHHKKIKDTLILGSYVLEHYNVLSGREKGKGGFHRSVGSKEP